MATPGVRGSRLRLHSAEPGCGGSAYALSKDVIPQDIIAVNESYVPARPTEARTNDSLNT